MLRGLGFRDADFDRQAREMSGGWIMRARLARLLVMEPDLLLLDEPTNHLDLLSLLWLQNYLKNYSGAVLLISHDRQFMDEVVTQVHEISEKKLIAYTGNYTDYLRQREERYEQQLAAYKNQQKEIAALQEFADRFRSGHVQGVAGHEQAQADRAHGADREAAGAAQAVPLSDSASRRAAGSAPSRWRAFTWPTATNKVYRGPRPHDRTRRAHRAGRAERRGQIHAAENPRGRGASSRKANATSGTTPRSVTSASIAPPRSIRRGPCSRK